MGDRRPKLEPLDVLHVSSCGTLSSLNQAKPGRAPTTH